MGATLEWDCIPFTLTTPQGDLDLNQQDALGEGLGGYYLLNRAGCSMGAPLRVTTDDVPQDDGSVPHRVLTGGYRVNLALELWKDATEAATGETLVAMNDLLLRHLNRIRDDGLGRLTWNPSGDSNAERMVDDLWWVDDISPENGGGSDLLWAIKFGMVSPFPYAMLAAEVTTSFTASATHTLNNTGSARFYPVIKVYGATSEFAIVNAASGKEFHYDAAQPGGIPVPGSGGYVELDFFRNTAYINGSGLNAKAAIDPTSDFWPLEIGNNAITITGAACDILWQPAFA